MDLTILRLDTPAMRAVRGHALAGDDLGIRRDGAIVWLAADGVDIAASGAGRQRLSFLYASAEARLALSLGMFEPATIEAVLGARRRMALDVVDRAWRPTLSRLGRMPDTAEARETTVTQLGGLVVAAARRGVHPSYLMDRLMMRQRAIELAAIDALLAGEAAAGARRSA